MSIRRFEDLTDEDIKLVQGSPNHDYLKELNMEGIIDKEFDEILNELRSDNDTEDLDLIDGKDFFDIE